MRSTVFTRGQRRARNLSNEDTGLPTGVWTSIGGRRFIDYAWIQEQLESEYPTYVHNIIQTYCSIDDAGNDATAPSQMPYVPISTIRPTRGYYSLLKQVFEEEAAADPETLIKDFRAAVEEGAVSEDSAMRLVLLHVMMLNTFNLTMAISCEELGPNIKQARELMRSYWVNTPFGIPPLLIHSLLVMAPNGMFLERCLGKLPEPDTNCYDMTSEVWKVTLWCLQRYKGAQTRLVQHGLSWPFRPIATYCASFGSVFGAVNPQYLSTPGGLLMRLLLEALDEGRTLTAADSLHFLSLPLPREFACFFIKLLSNGLLPTETVAVQYHETEFMIRSLTTILLENYVNMNRVVPHHLVKRYCAYVCSDAYRPSNEPSNRLSHLSFKRFKELVDNFGTIVDAYEVRLNHVVERGRIVPLPRLLVPPASIPPLVKPSVPDSSFVKFEASPPGVESDTPDVPMKEQSDSSDAGRRQRRRITNEDPPPLLGTMHRVDDTPSTDICTFVDNAYRRHNCKPGESAFVQFSDTGRGRNSNGIVRMAVDTPLYMDHIDKGTAVMAYIVAGAWSDQSVTRHYCGVWATDERGDKVKGGGCLIDFQTGTLYQMQKAKYTETSLYEEIGHVEPKMLHSESAVCARVEVRSQGVSFHWQDEVIASLDLPAVFSRGIASACLFSILEFRHPRGVKVSTSLPRPMFSDGEVQMHCQMAPSLVDADMVVQSTVWQWTKITGRENELILTAQGVHDDQKHSRKSSVDRRPPMRKVRAADADSSIDRENLLGLGDFPDVPIMPKPAAVPVDPYTSLPLIAPADELSLPPVLKRPRGRPRKDQPPPPPPLDMSEVNRQKRLVVAKQIWNDMLGTGFVAICPLCQFTLSKTLSTTWNIEKTEAMRPLNTEPAIEARPSRRRVGRPERKTFGVPV
ncbi:hypothetical protein GNI_013870 [Gregarina niphandrodes]|uniref:Uncharacterized protein n=1 Tax=Gregarina niphandrodes TaxID=110365 RepID=A0A023BCT7_GRENI|nr:hypothetical protein GNI_013870 [Gregarina niphandrodes]EZG83904.1 hypothetical protein GNI_013870 [Gregarina niphandrodes]|eukprot:XP_011128903.1 hypothetical protein GNI_013870 [Gregarina niphandrodes]